MTFTWPKLILIAATVCTCHCPIFGRTNSTKEPVPGTPLAKSMPRLPPSYEIIESNSTEPYADPSSKFKNYSNVKEVREPPQEDIPPPKINGSSFLPEPSSSNANYVSIGESKPKKIKYVHKNLQDGFKPFVPSPSFVADATFQPPSFKENDNAEDFSNYAHFKSNIPVEQEQFYSPHSNSYGSYGVAEGNNFDYDLSSYSKYNDKFIHLTTYAPPKINPMHRPALTYKLNKKYPFKNGGEGQALWKSHEYFQEYPKHHFDYGVGDDFLDQPHLLNDGYNVFEKPHTGKPHKKTGLLQILTTLIPIGLLLSALPPRVIFINTTNPVHGQKPFFRNLEREISRLNGSEDASYNLVANIGLRPSPDTTCNKRKICEVALNGTHSSSSFTESSLWHLLSRSSDTIRTNLNLQDVFEAVIRTQCSKFTCSEDEYGQHEFNDTSTTKSPAR